MYALERREIATEQARIEILEVGLYYRAPVYRGSRCGRHVPSVASITERQGRDVLSPDSPVGLA
jgi:hypothetical protein